MPALELQKPLDLPNGHFAGISFGDSDKGSADDCDSFACGAAATDSKMKERKNSCTAVPPRLPVPASNRLTIAIDGTYVKSDLTNG